MGYKAVCLTCRKAFSTATSNQHMPEKCSECDGNYIFYNHKFRPPKRDDVKAWKVVNFLYEHGFTYQHIYKDLTIREWYGSANQVAYPRSLDEAKEFVIMYKSQANGAVK